MVFSGLKEDYAQFKSELIDECIAALPTEMPYGAVGLILPDAEYLLLPGVTAAFVRKPAPGPPIPRPIAAATAAQVKFYEIDVKLHEFSKEEYHAQLKAEAKIKTFLLNNLDPISLRAIKDPTLGNLTISAAQMFVIVTRLHGTQLPDDLDALAAKYKEVYVTGPVKDFLSAQDENCKKLATAGEPVALRAQLRNTIDSLLPCGMFDQAIALWKILHADGSTRTAANLRDTMCTAYDTAGSARTAGSRSVAAAAKNSQTDLAAVITSTVAATMASYEKHPARSDRTSSKNTTANKYIHYCWFHGTNSNHPSKDCNQMGTNLALEKLATAADKKGGKETPFVPYHKRGK